MAAKIVGPDLTKLKGEIQTRGPLKGAFEFPQFGYYRKTKKKPCAWNEKDKPFPTGRVELDVVTGRDAEAVGVRAGPALRLCIRENEVAPIVPVDSPDEAQAIGAAYRDCVVAGNDKKACALDKLEKFRGIKPDAVHFGAAPRRRRRKAKR